MVMLYEYFALIFVRARASIVFFSRTAALSFVAFHVYFYHFQMGYFGLAAWSGFFGMFAVKLYVLQAIELPAYTSGEISHDNPRAHFVELPCEFLSPRVAYCMSWWRSVCSRAFPKVPSRFVSCFPLSDLKKAT